MNRYTRLVYWKQPAIRDALERAAEAERQSVSDLGVIILFDWLAERGYLPKVGQARCQIGE